MQTDKYLKARNAPLLWSFLGINIAVFVAVVFSGKADLASLNEIWSQITIKDGIVAAGLPVLAVVMTGVLGDIAKARIVFWRIRTPLPGCRAFSHLMLQDPRIDVAALTAKLGELPGDGHQQNSLCYRLYKKHCDKLTIEQAHRAYLLTRDLAATSAVLLCLFAVATVVSNAPPSVKTGYPLCLAVQYFLCASAARNYGRRFVANVLVEESRS